ncbi:MAG TPA: branched-chain amino acid ABC transporter permease [Deltaproteobacteria bacterium]|nr:branched-chain amino acid ABC transporter permease [Deltaproteobacteria bacterium]
MPTRALVTSYAQDLALFPDRWHRLGLVLFSALLLTLPWVADPRWLSVSNLALVAIVGSVALMILTGFAGQISMGHAAFLALGAYTTAVLGEQWALPFWLALPAGGAVAAAVGLAIGPFALRLRGLYLAIVTLGLVFLVNHMLLTFSDLTHGVSGIAVPMVTWFGAEASATDFRSATQWGGLRVVGDQKLYFLFLALATGAVWVGKNIQRSNTGRAMMAVRDQDLAASVLGVDPARTKVTAFGLSSFLAGIAGGMFALQQQYITIEPPFDLNMSIEYIAMIVLGGMGTVFGAVAGAVALVALSPLAEIVGRQLPLIERLSSAQQSTVLFSALVLAVLVFEPMGLLGLWLRIKRYFAAWPFRY